MEIVNKTELAAHFGVSVQAVNGWVHRGCPQISKRSARNPECQFDLHAVEAWRSRTMSLQSLTQRSRREDVVTGLRHIADGLVRHRLRVVTEKLQDLPDLISLRHAESGKKSDFARILREEVDRIVASIDPELR